MRLNHNSPTRGSVLILIALLAIVLAQPTFATFDNGDDWCPRTPGYWKNHTSNWNTSNMQIGGANYNASEMLNLLRYGGSDASSRLARHLVATKLNLLEGSSSVVAPTVGDADVFLSAFPPGSGPTGSDKDLANLIKDELDSYNNNEGDNLCGDTPDEPGEPDENCVDRADGDQWSNHGGGHALWLPGIGKDFVFDGKPGTLQEFADGTAQLTGIARRASNSSQAFEVNVQLTGFTRTAPAGSPKKELSSNAYIENGGPVDTSTWHYYTDFSGTLTGVDDFAGAVLEIAQRGPAFQAGYGANGKSIRYGASSWMEWWVIAQPNNGHLQSDGNGDFNIDLEKCTTVCVQQADPDLDYLSAGVPTYALTLSGIDHDYVASDEITFVEYEGGWARLFGRVHSEANPGAAFELRFEFGQRVDTPPHSSPHLPLPDVAYSENGGPIDHSDWHYYQQLAGRLIGRGLYEGAEIEVTPTGPAFQVGDGASGRNTLFGGSGWLGYSVVEQPNAVTFAASGSGDMTINDCPNVAQTPMIMPANSCFPTVVKHKTGTTGTGAQVEVARRDLSQLTSAPDGMDRLNFVSVGYNGAVVMLFANPILNIAGDDLTVVETSFAGKTCAQSPEAATVYASSGGRSPWIEIGSLCQSGSLDLGLLRQATKIMVVDTSDPGEFFDGIAADGFDLDGVFGHHCAD